MIEITTLSHVRNLILLCAGKRISGDSLSDSDVQQLSAFFDQFPGFAKNPVYMKCRACSNEALDMIEGEIFQQKYFLPSSSGKVECGRCHSTHVNREVVRLV